MGVKINILKESIRTSLINERLDIISNIGEYVPNVIREYTPPHNPYTDLGDPMLSILLGLLGLLCLIIVLTPLLVVYKN